MSDRISRVLVGALAGAALLTLGGPAARAADCGTGEVPVAETCVPIAEAQTQIRRLMAEAMVENDLTAVIAKVEIAGTPLLTDAIGETMTGVPASPAMHFRNGAVAITYMGVLLLRLQEEGLLSLDDPLSTWFPHYPRAEEITLAMLMTGTAGYADYANIDILPLYQNVFRHYEPEELIEMGLAQPMACDPGTCFNYAHTNYVILGLVLEQATGQPVEALLQHYLLEPMGLQNTRSESTPAIQEPALHAYTAERGRLEDSAYWNPSWTLARGAVMTSDIADLVTSSKAIASGALLTPESQALLLKPWAADTGPFHDDFYYGLGILVANGWQVQTPSFHGYWATMATLPSRQITIAVAMTSGATTPDEAHPNIDLFDSIASYLAPDQPPVTKR